MKNFLKILSLIFTTMALTTGAAMADSELCDDDVIDQIPEGTQIELLKRFDFDRDAQVSSFTAGNFSCGISLKTESKSARFISAGRPAKIKSIETERGYRTKARFTITLDGDRSIEQIYCTPIENRFEGSVMELLDNFKEHVKFDLQLGCNTPIEVNNFRGFNDSQGIPASSVR